MECVSSKKIELSNKLRKNVEFPAGGEEVTEQYIINDFTALGAGGEAGAARDRAQCGQGGDGQAGFRVRPRGVEQLGAEDREPRLGAGAPDTGAALFSPLLSTELWQEVGQAVLVPIISIAGSADGELYRSFNIAAASRLEVNSTVLGGY